MIKIGIIREEKIPADERVPLTPRQCKEVMKEFPTVEIYVQASSVRRFKDSEYRAARIPVVDDISHCDVLMGVKEVPVEFLIPDKTYFYFSHTIKKQPYNRDLLKAMVEKNIRMIDYEAIVGKDHRRLIGFGKYAGIVGAYNTFYAYGLRTKTFTLKRAYLCEDYDEMVEELKKVVLPRNFKIVKTGTGRVGRGVNKILNELKIRKVEPREFLTQQFDVPVGVQLNSTQYFKRKDHKKFSNKSVFEDPTGFETNFLKYAKVADMYIAGHFWLEGTPFLFTRSDAKSPDFKLKIIGDISADIDGPVASTLRPSTIQSPLYGYDPQSEKEVAFDQEGAITVMAVDNLPTELPKDASRGFGREIIDNVLPNFLNDQYGIIKRATICENGNLTPAFEYLRDYLEG